MTSTHTSGDSLTARMMDPFNPPICPSCGQLDQVQKVSAVVAAGTTSSTSIGAMPVYEPGITRTGLDGQAFTPPGHVIYRPTVGVTHSTTTLARRLTLPARFPPPPPRPRAYIVQHLLLAAAVWMLPAAWLVNAPAWGMIGSLVAIPYTVPIVRAFLRKRDRVAVKHTESVAEWKVNREAYLRAREEWPRAYYCFRCDRVFVVD